MNASSQSLLLDGHFLFDLYGRRRDFTEQGLNE
jgi:hypothetical protein